MAERLLANRVNVIKSWRFLHVDNFEYKFAFKCVLNRTENSMGEGEGAMAASATETEIDGYVIRTYVCWVKD